MGGKRKVTIIISEDVWKKWIIFVVSRTGSMKSISKYIEKALIEYMNRHGDADDNS